MVGRYYGVAELPRERFESAFNLPTGTRHYVTGNGNTSNFQALLNQVQRGEVIVLPAGIVLTQEFVVPDKPGTGAIYVVAEGIVANTFPVPTGQRVTQAHATAMPTLRTTAAGSRNALFLRGGDCRDWRFVGVRFDIAPNVVHPAVTTSMVQVGHSDATGDTAGWPSEITFDRCLWVVAPTQNVRRGLAANATKLYVTGCSFVGMNCRGFDSQCIGGTRRIHNWHVENCYFEGATENIMLGGGNHGYGPEHRFTDVTVRRSHFRWEPWRNPTDPAYAGVRYALKNHFELKGGSRILFEDNLLDQQWDADQDCAIKLKNQELTGSQYTEDVVIRYTVGEDLMTFIGIAKTYEAGGALERVVVAHNLATMPRYGDGMQLYRGQDLLVRNNTILGSTGRAGVYMNQAGAIPDTALLNNLFHHGTFGMKAAAGGSTPTASLYLATSGSAADGSRTQFARNVFMGSTANPARFPSTNGVSAFPATWEGVGFEDYAGGDYRVAASSPYYKIGTDGNSPGADIDAVLYRTRGCRTGIWT